MNILDNLTIAPESEPNSFDGYVVQNATGELLFWAERREVAEAIIASMTAVQAIKRQVHTVADQIWQGLLDQRQASDALYEIAGVERA